MHVRLLTSLVSPAGAWDYGDVYTCDDATARRLIAAGQAVPVEVGGVELAVAAAAPETAVAAAGSRKKGGRRV
jgi:hypothetical protein